MDQNQGKYERQQGERPPSWRNEPREGEGNPHPRKQDSGDSHNQPREQQRDRGRDYEKPWRSNGEQSRYNSYQNNHNRDRYDGKWNENKDNEREGGRERWHHVHSERTTVGGADGEGERENKWGESRYRERRDDYRYQERREQRPQEERVDGDPERREYRQQVRTEDRERRDRIPRRGGREQINDGDRERIPQHRNAGPPEHRERNGYDGERYKYTDRRNNYARHTEEGERELTERFSNMNVGEDRVYYSGHPGRGRTFGYEGGRGRGGYRGRGRGGYHQNGSRQTDPERRKIVKPYTQTIVLPSENIGYVIGKNRINLMMMEERLNYDAEFEIIKEGEDPQHPVKVSLQVFAISEDVLGRAIGMVKFRINEHAQSVIGLYYTLFDVSTPSIRFVKYKGEDYSHELGGAFFTYECITDDASSQKAKSDVYVAPGLDGQKWQVPPPTFRTSRPDIGLSNNQEAQTIALEKLPQDAFTVLTELCQPPRPTFAKAVARLGKFVVEGKSPHFPRHHIVELADIEMALSRELSRSRFVSLLPYATVARLYQNYIVPRGYKLVGLVRKVVVHYLIDNESFTASFKLPHPSTSIFAGSSSAQLPLLHTEDAIDGPTPSRNKGDLKRLLNLNFTRPSEFTDYRLTITSETRVQEESQFDNVRQLVEAAWKIKNQQAGNSNDPKLPMPEAYNGMKIQLCRYKTTEKYASDEEGLTINVIQLIQSEIAEGHWMSEEEFKKLATTTTTTTTNATAARPPPPPLNPESIQWDVSLRHHRLQEKVKVNAFEDLVGSVQDFMAKTKLVADSCGCAYH